MPPRVELLFAGSDQGATATAVGVEEAVRSIGAGADEANRSITTGMSATLVAFRSMDQSVQQLTTDYRAGIITQKQWADGLAAARAQAIGLRREAANLSTKELGAFSGVIDRTGKVSSDASFRIDLLRNSTRALAQQAAGIQGPIGGFVSQLLVMAGGSGLVVGVAAAIGVLALAYRALTREAREAEKAQDEAIDRLLKLRESSRTEEAKQAEDVAQARERLTEVTAELAAEERELAAARRGEGGPRDVVAIEQSVNELLKEKQKLLFGINAPARVRLEKERVENERAYEQAVKASAQQLVLLSIRLAHVGGDRDVERLQLKAAELAYQGLNREQIASQLANEEQAIQLEFEIEQRRQLNRLMQQYVELRRSLNQDAPLRLPGPPKDKPPARSGRDTVDTEPVGQAEELAHRMTDAFGLSIDMVEDLKNSVDNLANTSVMALGDAFEHVFGAIIEGGRVSGAEMVAGLLGAISKAAIHESAFYFARGLAALAGATFPFPNPANAVSAAQYFKAAAIMGTIGIGAGIAANVAGGGGGRGGLSPDRLREDTRSVQQLERGTLILRVPRTVRAVSPEFVDLVAQAMTDGRERNVILEEDDD